MAGIIGGIIGFTIGGFRSLVHIVPYITKSVGITIGLISPSIPIILILGKNFGEFRLALIKRDNDTVS
jgi:hypothetical protein